MIANFANKAAKQIKNVLDVFFLSWEKKLVFWCFHQNSNMDRYLFRVAVTGYLLVWDLLVKVWMRECSHAPGKYWAKLWRWNSRSNNECAIVSFKISLVLPAGADPCQCNSTNRQNQYFLSQSYSPFLLAHSSLSVPALEEYLLWVWVEQAHYSKVSDNLDTLRSWWTNGAINMFFNVIFFLAKTLIVWIF